MSKLIKALILITTSYCLPLIALPEKIFTLQILVLAIAAGIIMLTQPNFSLSEASSNKQSDRWSIFLIMVGGAISQIAPVVEWGYFRSPTVVGGVTVWTTVGGLMIASGLAFRIWAIRVLGKQFTSVVTIVDGHNLIQHGPYAIVRHPSYVGAYLAMLGAAVFLQAWISLIIAGTLLAYVYHVRLKAEERTLRSEFGAVYEAYASNTPALVPFANHLKRVRNRKLIITTVVVLVSAVLALSASDIQISASELMTAPTTEFCLPAQL